MATTRVHTRTIRPAIRLAIGLVIGLTLVSGWIANDTEAADESSRPNVLFIAVDDLNDWIGCLGGNPQCKTPNLDALAARGVLFDQAHCAAPACNPSRAALMTGVRPFTSGVYHNPQPWRPAMPKVMTLPQALRKAGYAVVGGGKIYHGRYNDAASWDTYFNRPGDPKPTAKVLADPHSRAGGVVWGRLDATDEQMGDHHVVNWAIEYLQKPNGKSSNNQVRNTKPFFLACGLYRPHMPWQVPSKYYDMYPIESIQLPDVPDDDLNDLPAAAIKMAKPQGDHAKVLKTDNWRYAVQAYLASITYADAEIGRLMAALDKSPHKENTIVVLWGDHGWHLGEKQHWRKFALWEEATRAPLMFVAPGVTKPNTVCKTPVDFMNIYPTILDLCGAAPLEHLEGKSMVPLLKDAGADWKRPAVTTHGRGNHAVRDPRWRLIQYADGGQELYDHAEDPGEFTNLATDPAHASTIQRLAKWLPKSEAANADYDPAVKRGKKKNANKGKKAKAKRTE